jgi:putative flavoprotein involved in K+ transport
MDRVERRCQEVAMNKIREHERVQTVVVGGGQAGLSIGYCLAKRQLPFLILDASARVGDSWRRRWDSLRLFTPARFDGLIGMPFPARGHYFPTKDEMADYLEAYAARFELPIMSGVRVERLSRKEGHFILEAGDLRLEAENVVVAMSGYQRPRVPSFASELKPEIVQLHAMDYRNTSQLREGGVLLVGAGNSGSEIGIEVVRRHPTWMSGRDTGHVPFRIDGLIGRLVIGPLFRVVFHRLLTLNTPIGRKARAKFQNHGGPLIRVKPADILAAGIERAPRTVGVRDGLPLLEDGRVLDVANVIWCTGFESGFESWIDLPVFDETGPINYRGVVESEPGLYFVGLDFQYSMSSTMIHGVARDAEYVAKQIATRVRRNAAEERAPHPAAVRG